MRTFLGVLLALVVSGDDEDTVRGFFGESVLLPCTCFNRNVEKDFKWQREDKSEVVLKCNSTVSYFTDSYKGRAETFLAKNISNCSVRLTNITADDQGRYRCSFYNHEKYNRFFVNLNVTVSYSVHQHTPITLSDSVVKVYQCDVKGRYREAEIQWILDGQPLTNSSMTNISSTYTLDADRYHFISKLMTELSWTSEPKCDVKAKGISTDVTFDRRNEFRKSPHTDYFRIQFKIIPIVLVLGLSLGLYYRCKVSQSFDQG